MEQIWNSDNADLCKRILAPVIIVYRPITIKELTLLVEIYRSLGLAARSSLFEKEPSTSCISPRRIICPRRHSIRSSPLEERRRTIQSSRDRFRPYPVRYGAIYTAYVRWDILSKTSESLSQTH